MFSTQYTCACIISVGVFDGAVHHDHIARRTVSLVGSPSRMADYSGTVAAVGVQQPAWSDHCAGPFIHYHRYPARHND
jgi:hypothetical protein